MVTGTPALNALASPRRLEILRLVWRDELAAGEIHRAMPDVTFGAVSLQLKTLVSAGLLDARADGQRRLYRARRQALGPLGAVLEGMWRDALWRLKLQAELLEARRGPQPRAVRKRDAEGAASPRTPRKKGARS